MNDEIQFGETCKRRATVRPCLHQTFSVEFTDWPARRGGSLSDLSKAQAIRLAKGFVDGWPYRFDPQKGIVVVPPEAIIITETQANIILMGIYSAECPYDGCPGETYDLEVQLINEAIYQKFPHLKPKGTL